MEVKCRRDKRKLLISIYMLLFVAGCESETLEEKSTVQQEEIKKVIEEENSENVDSDIEMGNYEYCILEDDSVKILKYTGNESVVFIPEKLEGKTVSVIGESAFQKNGQISQVVFPTGIVKIEERAFEGCQVLQYVFLNTEVKEIEYRAFGDCLCLEEITFPEGMEDLGTGICEGCIGLKKIVIPKSMCYIDENAFLGCTELQLIYGDSEFAKAYAEKEGKIYVDYGRIREEGNQVW